MKGMLAIRPGVDGVGGSQLQGGKSCRKALGASSRINVQNTVAKCIHYRTGSQVYASLHR